MIRLFFIFLILTMVSCRSTYFSNTIVYNAAQENKQNVYRLDLSNKNLTQLPIDISEYTNLKYINLSNNHNLDVESAGASIIKLQRLEVLKIDSNGWNKLPTWVGKLNSLKNLSLCYNPKLNIDSVFFVLRNLQRLEKLNVSHNGLTEIPESVNALNHLENIRLSHNKINTKVSYARLSKLKNLKFLWLDDNYIGKIPSSIGLLSQISELYLGNNQIKELPKELISCKKLSVLYLGNNQFKNLPDEILQMKLRMLVLYGNQITSIPTSYKKRKCPLAILILDNNFLNEEQQHIAKKYFTGFFMLSQSNQRKY